jgi:hypothetical protein
MGLFGKLGALIVGLIGNAQIRILAFKYFIRGLIMALVPLVILLSFNIIFGVLIDWIVAKVDAQTLGTFTAYTFAGLGAYIWFQIGMDVVLGIILSAFTVKMALRAIPFVRL